ncbi:phenylalanyl-tRNA synthetase, alpha subunit family protein [Cryptosporidium serpentis]
MTELNPLAILTKLDSSDCTLNTLTLSQEFNCDHERIIGIIKSLESHKMVKSRICSTTTVHLTEEALEYLKNGTPEYQLIQFLLSRDNFSANIGELPSYIPSKILKIGLSKCLHQGFVTLDKVNNLVKIVNKDIDFLRTDRIREHLKEISLYGMNEDYFKKSNEDILLELKKRKLVNIHKKTFFLIEKGTNFSTIIKPEITDITQDMILDKSWESSDFKPYNFFAKGKRLIRSHIHPLTRSLLKFKRILLHMGFEEMPTNRWVESSFWNFDTLFQPQQHPARDSNDTFFLNKPNTFRMSLELDEAHINRVRDIHQIGGYGSIGLGYNWDIEEASRNILRTHTTAVSARMIYYLAKSYSNDQSDWSLTNFKRKALFSIDRVFRNESIDATHLAEFHQVEGLIIDRNLCLGDLLGTFSTFYEKIGISKLKFKPAFNPYTEPSMEVFGYHEILKKWIEVGNSGMFRPEVLRSLGLPEGIVVIAWGLSLERPTMIHYNIPNIRNLFSYRANIFT